jgi:hypothetical protein
VPRFEGLNNLPSFIHVRKFATIVFLVSARQDEERLVRVEKRPDTIAGVSQQSFSAEESTELLRLGFARDQVR